MELCSYKEKAALEVKELSSIFPNKNIKIFYDCDCVGITADENTWYFSSYRDAYFFLFGIWVGLSNFKNS